MRRNRKSNAGKERIIMIASSAFVLAALTMTGIYMQMGDKKSQDGGYTLDFTALEENLESKDQEIALNVPKTEELPGLQEKAQPGQQGAEDDLDYMPLEAGSGNIEIPGLTAARERESLPGKEPASGKTALQGNAAAQGTTAQNTTAQGVAVSVQEPTAETPLPESALPVNGEGTATAEGQSEEQQAQPVNAEAESARQLHFAAEDGLRRPLEGEAVIPFSMSKSVYFSTLEEYKYNSALMIGAQEGTSVFACAAGQVVSIFENEEIGQAVTMDLGDGYLLTYGQIKGINLAPNSYVEAGDMIGSVAAPTKYYCVEGANLYLKLTRNEIPIDPEALFR